MSRIVALVVPLLLLALVAPGMALAQEASPAASPAASGLASAADEDRLDLAAMVLTAEELPPGYANVDERSFLTAQGVSTFFASEGIPTEEIEATGLRAMYDSFYEGAEDEGLLYLNVAEFGSPEEVEAAFPLLEDEARTIGEAELLALETLPGPGIGDDPSETTVAIIDYSAFGGPVVGRTGVAFRVENLLVTVGLETPTTEENAQDATPAGATPAAPDSAQLQLVTEVAIAFAERIEAVQGGQTPEGVDPELPPLVLPTDEVWPNPGVAAEGYKEAAQILGTVGPAADLADQFQGGYGRTVAPGTGPDDLFPRPPFVTIGVSGFASEAAARGALAEAADLPLPGPLPPPAAQEPVADVTVPGADASAVFRSAFEQGRPPDSARVAFVVGERLATIDVQGAASAEEALAAAEDLAAQQATCLAADGACTTLVPPAALASLALAQEATPALEDVPALADVLVPPEAEVGGLSLAEWSARQWQWFLSFPDDVQPLLDETGERCNLGQSGPVFFLVGGPTTLERTCTVPLGTAVFVPFGGAECSTVEPPPFFGGTEEELRACADAAADRINVAQTEVTVDGQAVEDLAAYRTTTPAFALMLPEPNLFGAPAGPALSVADGYQLILDALPEGEHVVTVSDPGITVTYRLTVAAPQVVEPDATPTA